MCRSHRRCRTNKAGAARRARNYRARRKAADPATPTASTSPATGDPETADQPPTGGDVTPTDRQGVAPGKPRQARKRVQPEGDSEVPRLMRRVEKALRTAEEAQYGTPPTAEERAARQERQEREEARVEQLYAEIAQERRARQQAPRQSGPVDVAGDGNITVVGGGDVTRAKRATGRTGRRTVEDHTGDDPTSSLTGRDENRVWTVSSSPTSGHGRGVDARISQDDAGNLTIADAQGPLYITRNRDGRPKVTGDVTSASSDQPAARAATSGGSRQQPNQQPTRRRTTRTGDVTPRHRRASSGQVNVVGDGNITVTSAGPATVRVGNYAAPGAHVGIQSTGHVHGATVHTDTVHTGTGDVTGDSTRARDIARDVADRARQAAADAAGAVRDTVRDAVGDVTHHDSTGHHGTGAQGIQAPHVHGSRVIRDRD